MRSFFLFAALIGFLGPPGIGQAQERAAGASYRIIVHPSRAVSTTERRFLADAFLKKVTRWPDGSSIRPVDLGVDSPVRRQFTQDVLGRSVAAVKSHWQQLIFSGRDIPPPEMGSDEEVLAYVLRHPGAVGYVSMATPVGEAKVLGLR